MAVSQPHNQNDIPSCVFEDSAESLVSRTSPASVHELEWDGSATPAMASVDGDKQDEEEKVKNEEAVKCPKYPCLVAQLVG